MTTKADEDPDQPKHLGLQCFWIEANGKGPESEKKKQQSFNSKQNGANRVGQKPYGPKNSEKKPERYAVEGDREVKKLKNRLELAVWIFELTWYCSMFYFIINKLLTKAFSRNDYNRVFQLLFLKKFFFS